MFKVLLFAGTLVSVLVTSSRIANISADQDVYLNLVLVDGRVFSYPLLHCGSLLSGMITIPSMEFEHQLEGFDTDENNFITSVATRVFETIGMYACTESYTYLLSLIYISLIIMNLCGANKQTS